MKTLALAAIAVTLTAGAALAQSGSGSAAGGPLGDVSRRNGVDPWGTTYGPPGVLVGPGVVVDEPMATGTVIVPNERTAPGMIPGTPAAGKGNYAGGPRGEMLRRQGIDD
jgi:hypothetical protein